jgi:exodeoxyribonuclease VII small subunit
MTSTPPETAAAGADAPMPEDIARMSFEEALKALEEIVQHLEAGRVDLDGAVAAYDRGVRLRRHCESRLAEARAKVERITAGPDGQPASAPLDVE